MVWNTRALIRDLPLFSGHSHTVWANMDGTYSMWKISFFPAAPHYHLLSVISGNTVAAFSKSLSDFLPDRGIQVALVPFFIQRNLTSPNAV